MCRFLTALTPDVLRLTTINTSGTFLLKNEEKKSVFELFRWRMLSYYFNAVWLDFSEFLA